MMGIPAIKRAIAAAPARIRNKIRFSQHLEKADAYGIQQQQKAKKSFIIDVEQGKRSINFLKHQLYPYQQQSLKAFACLKGEQTQLEKINQIDFIEQCLIQRHGLLRQALALWIAFNEDDESLDAKKLLPLIKTLYQYIQTQIQGEQTMSLAG